MNEDKRELAELLERHAREMAAHFLGHVNSIQDAALSKLLRTASEALTAVGAHLRARREEGRPEPVKAVTFPSQALECPKCANLSNLHFLGGECTGCDICNDLPSLTESCADHMGGWRVQEGWYFSRRGGNQLWNCHHDGWHPIQNETLVWLERGYLYCREHAELHGEQPVVSVHLYG